MRWIIAVAIGLVALGAARAVAAAPACKGGKVVFRVTTAPISSTSADQRRERWEVRASGAWQHVVDDVEQARGCLRKPDLKVFLKTLARARFRVDHGAGGGACIRAPERTMTYAAPRRKKQVTVEVPCGAAVEQTTARLFDCLWAAADPQQERSHVTATCKGG